MLWAVKLIYHKQNMECSQSQVSSHSYFITLYNSKLNADIFNLLEAENKQDMERGEFKAKIL